MYEEKFIRFFTKMHRHNALTAVSRLKLLITKRIVWYKGSWKTNNENFIKKVANKIILFYSSY
jgi:hypothetical protein